MFSFLIFKPFNHRYGFFIQNNKHRNKQRLKKNYVPVSILPFEVSILIPVSERLILNVIYSESIYDMVGGCL